MPGLAFRHGIEAWVQGPDDIARARTLIEVQEESQRGRKHHDAATQPVLVFCEACGWFTSVPRRCGPSDSPARGDGE